MSPFSLWNLLNPMPMPPRASTPEAIQGLLVPGNINLKTRPIVKNPDGSISTVRSMSFGVDGKEILVPTVSDDGRIMSDEEAIRNYRRTGKHLGIFSDPDSATAYAERLHNDYANGKIPGYPAVNKGATK